MRFTVIAYAVLVVVNAKNETNTKCCSEDPAERTRATGLQMQYQTFQPYKPDVTSAPIPFRSADIKDVSTPNVSISVTPGAGLYVEQYRTQYMEQNRYPFQPYKPNIPKIVAPQYAVKSVIKPSQFFSATPSSTPAVVTRLQFSQNESFNSSNKSVITATMPTPLLASDLAQPMPFNTDEVLNDTLTPVGVHFGQSRNPYETYKPDIPSPNERISYNCTPDYCLGQKGQSQGSLSQHAFQYKEQYRSPFQTYRPFIPFIPGPHNTYSSMNTVFPTYSGLSPEGPSQSQYQTQYTEENRYPYQPYKPAIPNPLQTVDRGSAPSSSPLTSFGSPGIDYASIPSQPQYSQTITQHHAQYMQENPHDSYQPYKPFIPPFQTVEPVSVVSPASSITPSAFLSAKNPNTSSSVLEPLPPAPAINISIISNGRSLFEKFDNNNTSPLFKILINNMHNYNSL